MTITATIHTYWISDKNSAEYVELCAKLTARGLKKFAAIGANGYEFFANKVKPLDDQTVQLETKHLFHNQWNTAPTVTSENGLRLMDWNEPISPNKRLAYGYWLEYDVEEVRALRAGRLQCGYCGHQTNEPGDGFCRECIGSEYLEEDNLPLLRLLPVATSFGAKRTELTEAEHASLYPEYLDAQLHGKTARDKERIAKQRADLLTERDKTIATANTKYDGYTWLMDHGIKTGNVIYYDHKGVFSIGWRRKLSATESEQMRAALDGFPFKYEIQEAK